MEDTSPKSNWKVNQVIRNKINGHPFLVLHVSKFFCNVVDLESHDPLVQTLTLLPRNFDEYTTDINMALKKNDTLNYEPIVRAFA